MPPTGPRLPTTASAAADWSNPNNALVSDGVYAVNASVGPGGGGHAPTQLKTAGYGFLIPSTAVIDGIVLEAQVQSGFSADSSIIVGTTGKSSTANPTNFGQSWPVTEGWITWGSPTDLWGQTWTPSDINNASFGGSVSAYPGHSTDTIQVDAMRITIYWHTPPADVPHRWLYKVYDRARVYLGNLPNVKNDFSLSHEINTGGSQMTIECGISADTSYLPSGGAIMDESGGNITDENGDNILSESADPLISAGGSSSTLIKNGNFIEVWEYGYYCPNGRRRFSGDMRRLEASFGGDAQDNSVRILCYSDGSDMDNSMLFGSPFLYTADQQQTSQNAVEGIYANFGARLDTWQYDGQTFTIGAGVTNLGAISLLLNGLATVTVTIYASPSSTTTPLATVTQNVATSGTQEVLFGFPNHIPVTAGTQYFFTVTINANQSISIYYQNSNVYSGGSYYSSIFTGTSGGAWIADTSRDLWFKSFSSNGQTIATFTSQDPTTGIVAGFMSDYRIRGGSIGFSSSTIQATGLSLTYTFNTNTVYEGLQAMLAVSPSGFYYYVDLANKLLYFKQASTTADILLTKKVHINRLTIIATIENVHNIGYFTGGVVSGNNLYRTYQNTPSMGLYGPKLNRLSDNRVVDNTTADAVLTSSITQDKDESFQTTVTVLWRTMDIGLLHPGLVVSFRGFGTFVDELLAQIVRIDFTSETATLTLGILPPRLNIQLEKVTRGLIASQTVANPATPN